MLTRSELPTIPRWFPVFPFESSDLDAHQAHTGELYRVRGPGGVFRSGCLYIIEGELGDNLRQAMVNYIPSATRGDVVYIHIGPDDDRRIARIEGSLGLQPWDWRRAGG